MWRAACRRWWRREGAWRRACAALAALALLALPAPLRRAHSLSARLAAAPRDLAHLLADFTHEPTLEPTVGEWRVLEESGNQSWWRYRVEYSCGGGCEGAAELAAGEEAEAAGAHPRRYHVRAAHTLCAAPPMLRWPTVCVEEVVSAVVEREEGAGARYREEASRACPLLAAACGLCARAPARLPADRAARLHRLRILLHERDLIATN